MSPIVPSPAEIVAALLADEVQAHGSVRPPWELLPKVHPFDIAWRMGSGEEHIMLWAIWGEGRDPGALIAAITRHGAVPADGEWWAWEAIGGAVDGDLYDLPFEEVRAALTTAGIAVEGVPSEE